MKILINSQPHPPVGYSMFAQHANSGWQMWVPPTTDPPTNLIQQFQFRNPKAGFIVTPDGGGLSIGVGSNTDVYHNNGQVYCSDISNNYDRNSRERPRLPRFVGLWVAYLCKIKAVIHAHEVELHNVANDKLREYLVQLGFKDKTITEYVGQFTDIETTVKGDVTGVGWTLS